MSVSIYKFQSYKKFIQSWVQTLPKSGHGFYRKLALKLNVSSTLMSQIFHGEKQISLELAFDVATEMGLNNREVEYFVLLVEFERAGTQSLRELFLKKIKSIQQENKKLEKKIHADVEVNEITKSVFYSDWLYSAVRNFIAIEQYADLNHLSDRLRISPQQLREVIDFLVQNGFCVRHEGRLKVGPQKTFISNDSPWVQQHHKNWRIKALEKMPYKQSQNLFYTGPMSMSTEVAEKVRDEISEFLEKVYRWVGPSSSDTVRCLNIDWFEY